MLIFYSYTLHFNVLVVFHIFHISLFSSTFFFGFFISKNFELVIKQTQLNRDASV